MGVIYKATNQINKKSYIGQTVNFPMRKKDHLKAKDDYSFHVALRKYGQENFIWEILEECENDQLGEREQYWISYYNTYYDGYNETQGGDNADALLKWKQENKEEVKKNALNGLKYANEYWEKHPEERKQQLERAQKAMIKAVNKPVRCIELNLEFDSISDAERWSLSHEPKIIRHQSISKVCKGHYKTAGGYHWEYIIKDDLKEEL